MVEIFNVVRLIDEGTSLSGGKRTAMKEGLVGRVCRRTSFGFCCVQFKGVGCRRVHEDRLEVIDDSSAPDCSDACMQGSIP